MKFILKDKFYLGEADILVRVYDNQSATCDEQSQCVGEILFRPNVLPRQPIRFSSWLPRGLVEALKEEFENIDGDYTVQISNELPDTIGVLTSCRENFEIQLRDEFLPGRVVVPVGAK